MKGESPPASLRVAVEQDLAPVTPLSAPWRRSGLLAPAALVTLLGIYLGLGSRLDADEVGSPALWGLSALQVAAALALLSAALRESVPGTPLSRRDLLAAFAGIPVPSAARRQIYDCERHLGPRLA